MKGADRNLEDALGKIPRDYVNVNSIYQKQLLFLLVIYPNITFSKIQVIIAEA